MNTQQIIDEVWAAHGLVTGEQVATRANVLRWVNEALRRYQGVHPWVWLDAEATQAATEGAGTLTVPAGAQRVSQVLLTENGRSEALLHVSPMAFDRAALRGGRPHVWCYDGRGLRVAPAPSATAGDFRVVYTRSEPAVTDSPSSTPLLPAELHDVLVDHAAFKAAVALRESSVVSAFQPIGEALPRLLAADVSIRGAVQPERTWGRRR